MLFVGQVSTLRRAQQDSRNRQSMLESKVQELESLTKSLPRGASSEYYILESWLRNFANKTVFKQGFTGIALLAECLRVHNVSYSTVKEIVSRWDYLAKWALRTAERSVERHIMILQRKAVGCTSFVLGIPRTPWIFRRKSTLCVIPLYNPISILNSSQIFYSIIVKYPYYTLALSCFGPTSYTL